jgi:insertion element IS1 protein InsB
MHCPDCNSENFKKNGHIRSGKQNYMCNDCKRQFVEDPQNKIISKETWELVDKLLLEKIPIAGIARVTGISELWLQKYINKKYENIPQKVNVSEKKKAN